MKTNIDNLVKRIDRDAKSQRQKDQFLVWASIIGTMTAGFGDLAAKWISAIRP
jgi:hypothetical protein